MPSFAKHNTAKMIFLILAVVTLCVYIITSMIKPRNYPPGPVWYPVVGNLLQLKKLSKNLGGQHIAFKKLAEEYKSDIVGLKLGQQYVVAVSAYPLIKTVLTEDNFNSRPNNFFMKLRCFGSRKGITATDGEVWQVQRNFVLRHLKYLGYGKESMELHIKEELKEVLDIIQRQGPDLEITETLAPSVLNILWNLIAGKRFSRNDPNLTKTFQLMNSRSKAFDMSGGLLNYYPWLRHIIPEKSGFNAINRLNNEFAKIICKEMDEHFKLWTPGNNDDLMYAYITEMRKGDAHATFTYEQLLMVCVDLYLAGSETTSNTLGFAFHLLILYPEVQKKVQSEIDTVLEENPAVLFSARDKFPYLQAFILEVERLYYVIPIIAPRRVISDTTLAGYTIPKDATILASFYALNTNKEYWGDPDTFRPERFLQSERKLKNFDEHIPFGLGRRRCIGEALARKAIYLFLIGILSKYTVSIVPGNKPPSGKRLPGVTLSPEKYTMRFNQRQERSKLE